MLDEQEFSRPERINQLQETAYGYLQSAEQAIVALEDYENGLEQFNPVFFESTGLSNEELEAIHDYGQRFIDAVIRSERNQRNISSEVAFPKNLEPIVKKYKGISETAFFNPTIEEKYRQFHGSDISPITDSSDVDKIVNETSEVLNARPSYFDAAVLIGLSVMRFRQILSDPEVRAKFVDNSNYSPLFRESDASWQAVELIATFIDARFDVEVMLNTFRHTMVGSTEKVKSTELQIRTWVSELNLVRQAYGIVYDRSQIRTKFNRIVEAAYNIAADAMKNVVTIQKGTELQATEGITQAGLIELLAIETQAVNVTRETAKRAKPITEKTNSVYGGYTVEPIPRVAFIDMPLAETPLHDQLRQWEDNERLAKKAAEKAQAAEQRQAKETELEALRTKDIMSKAELKKIDDSNEVTALLVRGRLSLGDESIKPVLKDDAYLITGLVYKLQDKLRRQDRYEVFYELFDDLDREMELLNELGSANKTPDLNKAYDWLLSNTKFLKASSVDALRRIGNDLAAIAKM